MKSKIILNGNYEIFDNGEIRKTNNGKIKIYLLNGYKIFCYKGKTYYVHRLVAENFIINLENYKCVNHINGNKQDNRVENLEWCTYSHNNKEAYKLGLKKPSKETKKCRPIVMFDDNKKEICIFRKMKYADKIFKTKTSSDIRRSILTGIKAYGYYWKYLE